MCSVVPICEAKAIDTKMPKDDEEGSFEVRDFVEQDLEEERF